MSAALDALGQYRTITSQVFTHSLTHSPTHSHSLTLSPSLSSLPSISSSLVVTCGKIVSAQSSTAHMNQLMIGASHIT